MESSEIAIKALDRIRKSAKREAIMWLIVASINIVPVVAGVVAGHYYNAFLHFTFVMLTLYMALCSKRHMENIDIIEDCIKFNDECHGQFKELSALFHDANGKRWKAVDVLKLAKSEIERLPIDENRAKLLDEINRVLADNKTPAELMAEQVMRDMENKRKESAE